MADNSDKLKQLRERTMPEFKSRDDFYAYAASHRMAEVSAEQARKDINDNLLPIFKAAKELCEYLSGNKDYFSKGHMKHLYYMALVSRIIKNIDKNSDTLENKEKSIRLSDPHYRGIIYLNNGKKEKENTPFNNDSDKGFKSALLKSGLGFSSYDDQYTTLYFGAIQEDITPIFSEKQVCSVTGNILNWEYAKKSAVFAIAAKPFINSEVEKICKENGTPLSEYGKHYEQAEKNIQAKIDEFCDMKNKENQQQLQKGMEAKATLLKR